jgi:hypothetical protein
MDSTTANTVMNIRTPKSRQPLTSSNTLPSEEGLCSLELDILLLDRIIRSTTIRDSSSN